MCISSLVVNYVLFIGEIEKKNVRKKTYEIINARRWSVLITNDFETITNYPRIHRNIIGRRSNASQSKDVNVGC